MSPVTSLAGQAESDAADLPQNAKKVDANWMTYGAAATSPSPHKVKDFGHDPHPFDDVRADVEMVVWCA